MTHLSDVQLLDAAEGTLEPAPSAHLEECAACAAAVREIRKTLADVSAVPTLEPSPLFWEHFPGRVAAAIADAPGPSSSWWSPARLAWLGAAAIVIAGLLGFEATGVRIVAPRGFPDSTAAETAGRTQVPSPPAIGESQTDIPIDEDEAWALMRTLADDLHYDDALDAGILPMAGAVEHAATELPEAERAELVRLIRNAMKRTGA